MADQLYPVLGGAKARRHLLHTPQRLEQRLVEQIGADAQDALPQAMGAVGQAQVLQAGVMAVPTDCWACLRLQPQLPLKYPRTAAHRALVHGQGGRGPGLGASQFEQVKDVQLLQHGRRGVVAWDRHRVGDLAVVAASVRVG
jgi:hypothetical protein